MKFEEMSYIYYLKTFRWIRLMRWSKLSIEKYILLRTLYTWNRCFSIWFNIFYHNFRTLVICDYYFTYCRRYYRRYFSGDENGQMINLTPLLTGKAAKRCCDILSKVDRRPSRKTSIKSTPKKHNSLIWRNMKNST